MAILVQFSGASAPTLLLLPNSKSFSHRLTPTYFCPNLKTPSPSSSPQPHNHPAWNPPMEPEQQLRILDIIHLSPSPPPTQILPLPLSHLDADRNLLDISFRTLRFFPPHPSSVDPFLVLPAAFAAALQLFSPLAGALRGHHLLSSATDSVPLTLAASDLSLSDIDPDQPDLALLDRLAPADGDSQASPALSLQVTRFACGVIALGMRVAHSLCDGTGATKFLVAAARLAHGDAVAAKPVWERPDRLGPRRPPRVVVPFDRVLGFDEDVARRGPYGMAGDGQSRLVRECFHVSVARVERLRGRLAEEAGSTFTTFEVLTAFIWRARVMANETSSDEGVKMVYSMNISKALKPPLPDGYWGNMCVPVYVCLTAGELISQPLAETAVLIKKSKHEVNDEYVRSYIDFQELHYDKGITAGRGVSAFTDWRRLGHSEVDFGWGGPDVVLPLSWRLLGSTEPCFFLPYGATDERKTQGFKVFVALSEKALPSFTDEMKVFSSQNQQCI